LSALVTVDVGVQAGNDVVDAALVVEFIETLGEFASDNELGFQAFRGAEISAETILQRSFLLLINDGLGFFRGDLEMAVALHFLFSDFPPLFPILGDDVGHEELLDLIDRGLAGVALEDEFDQIEVMERGHFTELGKFGELARHDVVGRNALEGIGGEGEVHGVTRAILEIDDDFGKEPIPGGDFAHTPTAMKNKSVRAYLQQRIDLSAGNFPCGGQFI
jgi:hypothetical protein